MARVLVVGLNYAPEHAGIAPYTTGMARALAEAGHEVHVVAGFPYYPQWALAPGYRGLRTLERDGAVRLTRLRHYVPGSSTGVRRILHEASFAAHAWARGRHRADVVVAVSPSLLSVAAAARIARAQRAPLGVVVQDLYSTAATEVADLGGRAGGAVRSLESRLLRGAEAVVAVHAQFAETLTGLGVDRDRITVIPNWAHIPRPAEGSRERVRAGLAWGPGEVIALHAGNMGAKQHLTNLVAAARYARERRSPVRFVLLGDGAQRAEIAEQARGLDTLTILDPVPDEAFPDVLAAADALLVNERPGLHTMCAPSKLTSYFTAGRPIVAATEHDSPAAAELAASGAGVRVPPGAPVVLLDAITTLAQDPRRCGELAERGRGYAAARLNSTDAADRYRAWVSTLTEPSEST
ncbi:glycosyltransferase family 4 protein [Actinokineospora sp. NBRC 105648]|uniref:glycosyltransferase family 4 protein n=1 Tax=Actinokineospora sp. NBRC 105648 TaxID=3032206 RepID=UPI0024A312AD|nr:glycosyltransferase family 4 protein [Actinokineospora sp. NBRC 105648]GLZ41878.1 glycosyltransferase WbuB [Actinokineospora sp. NBRC 105648]